MTDEPEMQVGAVEGLFLKQLARLTGREGAPGAATAPAEEDELEVDDIDGDGARAEVVVFDHDLTPTQLRNLEGATGAQVLDRSTVILHIFQRHARSREARTQVEIASLKYLSPRLRATASARSISAAPGL